MSGKNCQTELNLLLMTLGSALIRWSQNWLSNCDLIMSQPRLALVDLRAHSKIGCVDL